MIDANLIKQHEYYNNQFFAKWARLYDIEKYFLFPLRRKAAKFLNLPQPKKLIDIATGTGSQAYELAKLGHDVVGVDLSPEMLEQARKKMSSSLKLSFLHTDATKLSFGDHTFDAASISLGLHDMPYEIDLLVLKEMKRVIKDNGDILIVDYMEPRKHPVAALSYPLIQLYETPNYKKFIKHGLDNILKKAGLSIYRQTNFLGLIQIVVAK